MYIKKQRLLTPGPTPLLPRALHAMMASDIHHRTQDFLKLYPIVLRDLKEVYGTQASDVLITVVLRHRRTGSCNVQFLLQGRQSYCVLGRKVR